MTQPKWKCVANLGDVDPVEYGGLFVLVDETGVYPPEIEHVEPPPDEMAESPIAKWVVHRAVCEPCSYINGVLSDNKFHPDKAAWFADSLVSIADNGGFCCKGELIADFCSEHAINRATAWKAVADYHGWVNLDEYPLHLFRYAIERKVEIRLNQLRGVTA